MNDEYNPKLAAMILLITRDQTVGRTALNKLLFFSDLAYFLAHGRTISQASYLRLPFGPVPEEIDVTRGVLVKVNALKEDKREEGDYYSFHYQADQEVADIQAARDVFEQEELKVIETVVSTLGNRHARELSDRCHEFEPWKSTESHEVLDFEKALHDVGLIRWVRANGLILSESPTTNID